MTEPFTLSVVLINGLLLAFTLKECGCQYLLVNRYSVYPGLDVSFTITLEEKDLGCNSESLLVEWYKENVTRDFPGLNKYDDICCFERLEQSGIYLHDTILAKKFVIETNAEFINNGTLGIIDVTLADTGIYCSVVRCPGANWNESLTLPGYLLVTVDNHGNNLPMFSLFFVVIIWSFALLVFMLLRAYFIQNERRLKKRHSHVEVVLAAQNELLV